MMIEMKGKYTTAKVFATVLDETTKKQIQGLIDSKVSEGSKVRIQADCHAGAGCVIGTTMTIKDRVCPNLVGVDIGCGMSVYNLGNVDIDLSKLDKYIREKIPNGQNINNINITTFSKLEELRCVKYIDIKRANQSIGSLGGGNHFIEIDKDDENNKYLVVHSGSRHLGLEVAKYYQKLAEKEYNKFDKDFIVNKLKLEHRERDIQTELNKFKPTKKGLEYLTGDSMEDYLHDMKIVQEFASKNRFWIMTQILASMDFYMTMSLIENNYWETIHNYIDVDNMILRKGSISALEGEEVLIPINMRDGSLICIGKSNEDYNYSAPHRAGRIMSRTQAFNTVNLNDFKESMKDVYSTSVNKSTLDESPFVYKSLQDILPNIQDTVQVIKHIMPIYNFKNSDIQ